MQLSRPSVFDVILFFTGLAAFVLHLLGNIFPHWWVVHERDEQTVTLTFYYGIWVIVDCRHDICVTTSSKMYGDRAWLIGPAVLFVLANVMLLATLVFMTWYMLHEKHGLFLRKLCVLLSTGSGGVIILGVLIFYKKKAGLRPSQAPETSDGDPSWALFLSTTAAIISIMNGVINGYHTGKKWGKSGEKQRKTVFGIDAGELELNVNALRRGELSFGKQSNKLEALREEDEKSHM